MKTARCSVDFDWVTRDVRDLIFHQQLQNERGHFVLKSIAQSFNSRAVDDVLKLAADASVGAVNLLSDSGRNTLGTVKNTMFMSPSNSLLSRRTRVGRHMIRTRLRESLSSTSSRAAFNPRQASGSLSR